MKVVITGGTGFVGQAVVRALVERGDSVVVLTRDPFEATERLRAGIGEGPGSARRGEERVQLRAWEPDRSGSWQEHVDGSDAILHLAGESLAASRLGEKLMARAHQSRVRAAELLVEAMEKASAPPRVFVSASGVGYYGSRHDDVALTEDAPPGDDLLARLCVDWENAARAAERHGARVVCARLGVVIDGDGGALPLMARPYRFFVGGPLGAGTQYFAWVHREDVVRVLLRCLDDSSIAGPVNLTAPETVTNEQFSIALGQVLRRPSWTRVPDWALRAALGEGAEVVLGGQRAVPRKLLDAGYEWRYPRVRDALRAALAR